MSFTKVNWGKPETETKTPRPTLLLLLLNTIAQHISVADTIRDLVPIEGYYTDQIYQASTINNPTNPQEQLQKSVEYLGIISSKVRNGALPDEQFDKSINNFLNKWATATLPLIENASLTSESLAVAFAALGIAGQIPTKPEGFFGNLCDLAAKKICRRELDNTITGNNIADIFIGILELVKLKGLDPEVKSPQFLGLLLECAYTAKTRNWYKQFNPEQLNILGKALNNSSNCGLPKYIESQLSYIRNNLDKKLRPERVVEPASAGPSGYVKRFYSAPTRAASTPPFSATPALKLPEILSLTMEADAMKAESSGHEFALYSNVKNVPKHLALYPKIGENVEPDWMERIGNKPSTRAQTLPEQLSRPEQVSGFRR